VRRNSRWLKQVRRHPEHSRFFRESERISHERQEASHARSLGPLVKARAVGMTPGTLGIQTEPIRLLHVGNFAGEERHFQIFVNIDLFWTEIDNLLRLAQR
jgi:hypothetical protein